MLKLTIQPIPIFRRRCPPGSIRSLPCLSLRRHQLGRYPRKASYHPAQRSPACPTTPRRAIIGSSSDCIDSLGPCFYLLIFRFFACFIFSGRYTVVTCMSPLLSCLCCSVSQEIAIVVQQTYENCKDVWRLPKARLDGAVKTVVTRKSRAPSCRS
jgi:hypothetical protein